MKTVEEHYDVVVCGGGLAGVSAAISAARHGAQVALVHDRPVLGGTSSSEVRVTPHGAAAFHAYARETGIIAETLIEERVRNHVKITENGWTNSVWDLTLYDFAMQTPGLTVHLNTPLEEAEVVEGRIASITARTVNAELSHRIRAEVFIDCTGDGTLGALAGAESRHGIEARSEFDEPSAPDEASSDTMGSSLHFKTVDVGHPVDFTPPPWAAKYEDSSFFRSGGRIAKTLASGYWWIEIGPPWNTIDDNEEIRHELTRQVLGIWDWYKNHDDEWSPKARNIALDWIGQVPGKRESRRLMGQRLLTEHDLLASPAYDDEVAYGGWYIDLHSIGGLYQDEAEPLTSARHVDHSSSYQESRYVGPFGIPLGALVSRDIGNLMYAGRNISATHVALGALRVQGTTSVMGQAVGTAAAQSVSTGGDLWQNVQRDIIEIQQSLVRDGCFLPHVATADPDELAARARLSASSTHACTGVDPDDESVLGGLDYWRDYPIFPEDGRLDRRLAQWIALGEGQGVDEIAVCLTNRGDHEAEVRAHLYDVPDIWTYAAEPSAPVRETTLHVAPGERIWVPWPVQASAEELAQTTYLRLDLDAVPNVEWHVSKAVLPGQVAAYEVAAGRHRRFGGGATLSHRVSPAQQAYPITHVVNGVTRPHRATNQWRSMPDDSPQWVQLDWAEPQTVAQVQLTFPGHLLREYHACPPGYRDPQSARDYRVQGLTADGWQTLAVRQGNYQTRVVHDFDAVQITRLRIEIDATNGDPSAGLFEVRCYAHAKCTPAGVVREGTDHDG
ncbi:FAD-dependent oxidoreductase [Pseudoclavibacter sp. 13-3]|uniref:FAD-dependent oxidoreductase n=1 Tax=Pseudoclavibacter sp. 13-3 TaxID=2901228 RepID=UPI001E4F95D7|nr:FAD-dependent oxidoreductase [Pseudoclavibacter sp. 13-3]